MRNKEHKKLCFDVSPYQKHLWRYHKMVEPSARDAEREGEDRYEAFPDFATEVFHRLYADEAKPIEAPPTGTEVFQKLHDQIGCIPEFDDLRKRCEGDERWAGISTAAMIDTILTSVSRPDQQLEDLRGDQDAMELLQSMMDNSEDPAQVEAIEETLAAFRDAFNKKEQDNQSAADNMDETQIRQAIRDAAEKANEEINAEEKMIESFYGGHEAHSGRQARQNIGRKLATALKDSERLKKIADLAGRLRRIAIQEQTSKPRRGTDEVTGIELGADLGRMVPTEMLWADEEIEMVFAGKLSERALLQTELNKIPPKQQGPIVIALDSSGSMEYNGADVWAGAVTLAFLEIARKQNRAFAIVHFGSDVLRVDQWVKPSDISIESLLEAVNFFAGDGGTNFMAPMSEALEIIRGTASFKEADIIMVTDGCADISSGWLEGFEKAREVLAFSVYSILVGGSTRADTNERFSDEVVHLSEVLKNDKGMHKFFGKV